MHHASIRTADIYRAIAFYEQLGFEMETRFTAGVTLACWMTGLQGRIELLQVPEPHAAADAFYDEHYTGYYHLSFDLTGQVESLPVWLATLETTFREAAQAEPAQVAPLRVLLPPQQQMIGDRVYEVAFIADADGLPLEFLRMMGDDHD
ncbi:MAG: VOC family protein [Leptolyngbyaceae cyanobacterium T60_A2020_046]|nr:VOC family protein [Leptolyngbyaceae cyanobacterium T60_A2020_046]